MQPLGVYDKVYKETPGNAAAKQKAAVRAIAGVGENQVSDDTLLLTFNAAGVTGRKSQDKKRLGIRAVVYKKWAPTAAVKFLPANKIRQGVKVCYGKKVCEVSGVKSEKGQITIYFAKPAPVSGYATRPNTTVFIAG